MANGAGQVGLAETHATVDEERIVRVTRPVGGHDGRRVSKLVAGANHKFTKRIARVEVSAAVACSCGERRVSHGISSESRSSKMRSYRQLCTDLSTDCSYLVSAAFGRLEPLSLGLLDR